MSITLPTLAFPSLQTVATLLSGSAAGVTAYTIAAWRYPRPVTQFRLPVRSSATTGATPPRGRIPLPLDAMVATPVEQAALEAPVEFIDRLAELSFDIWMEVGKTVAAHRETGDYATARALLAAAISDQRLNVAAWMIRDGVDTAAFYATVGRSRISRAERRTLAAAHGAAEGAALALLVRAWLPRSDLATLYAPFAACLAVADVNVTS